MGQGVGLGEGWREAGAEMVNVLPLSMQLLPQVHTKLGFLEMALQISLAQTFPISNGVQTHAPLASSPWLTWKLDFSPTST